MKHLSYMATLAKCPAQEVEILLHIISAQFDMTGSMSSFMPITLWRSCVANILRLLQLLNSNKHISLIERGEPAARPEKDELLNGAPIQLAGSLCAFAERLDDDIQSHFKISIRILKNIFQDYRMNVSYSYSFKRLHNTTYAEMTLRSESLFLFACLVTYTVKQMLGTPQ